MSGGEPDPCDHEWTPKAAGAWPAFDEVCRLCGTWRQGLAGVWARLRAESSKARERSRD